MGPQNDVKREALPEVILDDFGRLWAPPKRVKIYVKSSKKTLLFSCWALLNATLPSLSILTPFGPPPGGRILTKFNGILDTFEVTNRLTMVF